MSLPICAAMAALAFSGPLAGAQQEKPAPGSSGARQCAYTVTGSDGAKISGSRDCAQQNPADTPASKRFPYPGESGALNAPQATQAAPPATQPNQATPASPEPQKGAAPDAPASKRFPYPGEEGSAPPASTPAAPGLKDAGSSGDSSSSSAGAGESSSSSAAALAPSPDDVNSDTPPAPKRNTHRRSAPAPKPKDIAQQENEDVQVAGFYLNDKNYRGAYGRAQDAVRLADDDPEAHLLLAHAARKLGRLDEAEREYRRVLALDPVPKTRKAAEQSLKEMTGGN